VSSTSLVLFYIRNCGAHAKLEISISRYNVLNHANLVSGYELPRLNERFIYLLFFAMFCSLIYTVIQMAAHRAFLPYSSLRVRSAKDVLIQAHLRTEITQRIAMQWTAAILLAFLLSLASPILYSTLRPTIWRYSLRLARIFIK